MFYIAGEGQNGLRKRIEGWSRHNGVSIAKAPLYVAATLPPMIDLGNVSFVLRDLNRVRMAASRVNALAPTRYEGYVLRALWHRQQGDRSNHDMGRALLQ